MSYTLRRGLAAGFLAGLILALLDFVTDGAPGNDFPSVLHWFGINPANSTVSHFGGFLLLLVLACLFGLLFAAPQRGAPSAPEARFWGAGAWPALVAALQPDIEQYHEPCVVL